MILTKGHRISLVVELEKCNEEIEIAKSIIQKSEAKLKDLNANALISDKDKADILNNQCAIESFEIKQFFAEKRKELITEGLIEGELDF
jgi:hypothetical protein